MPVYVCYQPTSYAVLCMLKVRYIHVHVQSSASSKYPIIIVIHVDAHTLTAILVISCTWNYSLEGKPTN